MDKEKKTQLLNYEDAAEYRTNVVMVGWVCKTCGRFWKDDEDMARYCCCASMPCASCGGRTDKRYTLCGKCRAEKKAREEQEMFDKAEKVTEWDGLVFDGNTYYDNIEALSDAYYDDGVVKPKYVWCCQNVPIKIDIHRILDDLLSDYDPRYEINLVGAEKLCNAVEEFNCANFYSGIYEVDYTKAVLLGGEK